MKKVEHKNFKTYQTPIIVSAVVLFCTLGLWQKVEAGYQTPGTVISENLLAGQYVESITDFGYDATIPEDTAIQVQFSKTRSSWYSSAGAEDEWDTLVTGDHLAEGDAIDLSALGWTDPYFYYKVSMLTTVTESSSPTLSEIRVYFEEGSEPEATYATSGTLESKNILSGGSVENTITGFYYDASSIPSGTSLRVQFSQNGSTWYSSVGVENGWDSLSKGSHLIDLTLRGWSGLAFYYKMEFTGDGSATPVLDEIRVNYASASISDYPDPLKSGQTVNFLAEWPASLSVGVKLYVCKAEDGTSAGCGEGGTWCSNSNDFETGQTISCSCVSTVEDIGSNNYYVYICDEDDNCSSAVGGTFVVLAITSPSTKFEGGLKFKGGTKFK